VSDFQIENQTQNRPLSAPKRPGPLPDDRRPGILWEIDAFQPNVRLCLGIYAASAECVGAVHDLQDVDIALLIVDVAVEDVFAAEFGSKIRRIGDIFSQSFFRCAVLICVTLLREAVHLVVGEILPAVEPAEYADNRYVALNDE